MQNARKQLNCMQQLNVKCKKTTKLHVAVKCKMQKKKKKKY